MQDKTRQKVDKPTVYLTSMAANSVGLVDKCRIVTKFLFDSCRLQQPSEHHVWAACLYVNIGPNRPTRHLPGKEKATIIPLTTGSVAEFYIQPMLSCVGDVDIMIYGSTHLAIPAGYPPPSQLPAEFHSHVMVFEIIDSEYPCYVYLLLSYLLAENPDGDKYDVVQCDRHQYATCNKHAIYTNAHIHGPAVTRIAAFNREGNVLLDGVLCMRCLSWPTQATDWPTRHRNYGWPDSATVDRVISSGCDVVQVAHRRSRQDEWMNKHQWRLSFSRAEIILINSWMSVQQIVYHMLRYFVKTERLTDITADNTGTKMLCNYQVKTLMLWACEVKPRSWWIDDFNLVRICVVLLHTLDDWLKINGCPHYFVVNCNLSDIAYVEVISSQLASITESWLSTWFVNNYLRKCAQLCPDRISRLFQDIRTSMKLQNAVTAVVDWRQNSALDDLFTVFFTAEFHVLGRLQNSILTLQLCQHWIDELMKIDSRLCEYLTAIVFLHVTRKTTRYCLDEELVDVLATILEQFIGKRRYCHKLNSAQSLSQAVKLMKVVVNNSCSTVQLIEIELSKAYLYRALRCKDSDSDSISCLANVYLAVLYYPTGHYEKGIDRCTLVTRSQNHSECSSHVVQGELLPKIDDNIDSVLGLAVFYQYVQTAALNQQPQYVSVFTTELFAHYMHMRCLSARKGRQIVQMSFNNEGLRYKNFTFNTEQTFIITDVLLIKLVQRPKQRNYYNKQLTEQREKSTVSLNKLDTSELVELLQQSAVEHLTTYRQFQAQKFGSVATIVTTDFEALYAYKHGNYQQCLQFATQNVGALLNRGRKANILTFREFIQLMDDDFVSLIALTLIADPKCRDTYITRCCMITQLTLSLYLMTQCQLKLHHSVTSLAQTLDYIEVAQRRCFAKAKLEVLTLTFSERKVIITLESIMPYIR